MKTFIVAIACTAAFIVSGCSFTKTVKPIANVEISELCIKQNPDVLMDDFLPDLERQVQAHGIKTRVYSGSAPPECKATMEYAAKWNWSMTVLAVYLSHCDLRVFVDQELVGQANYDAQIGGVGKTSDKLKVLTDELFAQFGKKSK